MCMQWPKAHLQKQLRKLKYCTVILKGPFIKKAKLLFCCLLSRPSRPVLPSHLALITLSDMAVPDQKYLVSRRMSKQVETQVVPSSCPQSGGTAQGGADAYLEVNTWLHKQHQQTGFDFLDGGHLLGK